MKDEAARLRHDRAVKPGQTRSNQWVWEIMIMIKIDRQGKICRALGPQAGRFEERGSCPEVGPVSAWSNPVKPSQTGGGHERVSKDAFGGKTGMQRTQGTNETYATGSNRIKPNQTSCGGPQTMSELVN
jgi:hypothetical protein